jgi:hypothetical protein
MLHKLRLALVATLLAVSAVSVVDSASAQMKYTFEDAQATESKNSSRWGP